MKKVAYIVLSALIVILSVILVYRSLPQEEVTGPSSSTPERQPVTEESEVTMATVYYATPDGNYLLPLNLTINATKEVAKVAMEKLLAGPPNNQALGVIPPETKLLELYGLGNTVYVNVTKDLLKTEPAKAQIAIDAILLTILPLVSDWAYDLQLLIDGEKVNLLGGIDISQPLEEPYINLINHGSEGQPVVFYLADGDGQYLVPRTTLQPAKDNGNQSQRQTRAIATVQALLDYAQENLPEDADGNGDADGDAAETDPAGEETADGTEAGAADNTPATQDQENDLYSPFWPGTQLLDLQIENHIAYVDFSQELLAYGGGSTTETMLIQCLYYSLTHITGILQVQILVEGETRNYLPEGTDISAPIALNHLVNFVQ